MTLDVLPLILWVPPAQIEPLRAALKRLQHLYGSATQAEALAEALAVAEAVEETGDTRCHDCDALHPPISSLLDFSKVPFPRNP